MSDLKAKLVKALGDTSLDDVETERLVDILADKVRRLESDIERLHGENAAERQRLHDEHQRLERALSELRRNPLFGAHGFYRFDGLQKGSVIIHCAGGTIREVVWRQHGIDTLLCQMPMEAPVP